MTKTMKPSRSIVWINPKLSPAEIREAEDNLRRYLKVTRQIFEQIRVENPKLLTELRRRATLRKNKAHN